MSEKLTYTLATEASVVGSKDLTMPGCCVRVLVPDQVYENQKGWVGKSFPAIMPDKKRVQVTLDWEAYGLFTSGCGDIMVKALRKRTVIWRGRPWWQK